MTVCAITPYDLRCEYENNPLGIDEPSPRLSWKLESPYRGQVQKAYRILAASSEALLDAGTADLWDSGIVESSRSIHIQYEGRPLESRWGCFWKVQVWDGSGNLSAFSQTAYWETGPLRKSDWQAKWIGITTSRKTPPPNFDGCQWVWSGEENCCYLRRSFTLSDAGEVEKALFLITADHWFGLWVNGTEVGRGTYWKVAQYIDLTYYLQSGGNTIAIKVLKGQQPAGVIGRLQIEMASGAFLSMDIDSAWKGISVEEPGWETMEFDDSRWPQATEVAVYGDKPWETVELTSPAAPCPYLRKEFSLDKTVAKARIYATSLGVYELRINGAKVGKDHFSPGWTDYSKRIQYQTYDVTAMLAAGTNCVGAILGDGWYAGDVAIFGRHLYGQYPLKFLAQLVVEYTDGSTAVIATDNSWKGSAGPLISSDLLMGETYDARLEQYGWDAPAFDDSAWMPADELAEPETQLVSQRGPAVQTMLHLSPIALTEPKPGVWIFDMGQNMVGRVRLKMARDGRHLGAKLRMRFGEMLNDDGTLYTTNLRSARQTDTYIGNLAAGHNLEYEPNFTFHGFRYVELTGCTAEPRLDDMVGHVIYSAAPSTGRFKCSNPMVNRLQSNIVWGQRGNFLSVPTDCPQRDERMGWTGDAQIFARTACFNMDTAGFFTKWMADVEDAQRTSGAYTDVAPKVGFLGAGTAAWGDAGVIVPWTVYQCYGDTKIIRRHYDSMCRWIRYLSDHSSGCLRPPEGYGDWLSINDDTPKDVLATAYFAYSTLLLSRMAEAIGQAEDGREFRSLFEHIRQAFNDAYVSDDGTIKGDTQTCYLLGLRMNLLPPEKQPLAANKLVDKIRSRNWHLSTGFVGVGYMNPVLTETGNADVAYRLLLNDTYPSWGYSIKNGATTIWERWNSYTKEDGFGDVGMNSFNHYSLGSVGEWLYRYVSGIDTDPECPGYERVVIRPHISGGLTWARGEYDSIRGMIKSSWSVDANGILSLDVSIPANTAAAIYVPTGNAGDITEGGLPAAAAAGVKLAHKIPGYAVYSVGSGSYSFKSVL